MRNKTALHSNFRTQKVINNEKLTMQPECIKKIFEKSNINVKKKLHKIRLDEIRYAIPVVFDL